MLCAVLAALAVLGCGIDGPSGGERTAASYADSPSCTAAAERLESCFGYPFLESCDEQQAEQLANLSCNELALLLLSGQADELGVDSALQDQLREVFQRAVAQVVKAALQPALGMLSALDRPFYLSLGRAGTEAAAASKAEQLAPFLAGHAGMEPTVMPLPTGFAVVHGRCPIDLAEGLGDVVGELIVSQPELVRLLGGSLAVSPTAEGVKINLTLPLSLLGVAQTVPAQLGCEQ